MDMSPPVTLPPRRSGRTVWGRSTWPQRFLRIAVLLVLALVPAIGIGAIVVSATRAHVPDTQTMSVPGGKAKLAIDITSVHRLADAEMGSLDINVTDGSTPYLAYGTVRLVSGSITDADVVGSDTWGLTTSGQYHDSEYPAISIDPPQDGGAVQSLCPGLVGTGIDVATLRHGGTVPLREAFLLPAGASPGYVQWDSAPGGGFYTNAGQWSVPSHVPSGL